MNKRERERLTAQENVLMILGFTMDEAATLRRISLTLRRWHELECGIDAGCIERDDATGKPRFISYSGRRWPVPDRERGALRRLARIIAARNDRVPLLRVVMLPDRAAPDRLETYIQPDPRGASLYILRPGDVPLGADPASYYTRGICIY
jgi:hypothetical protein